MDGGSLARPGAHLESAPTAASRSAMPARPVPVGAFVRWRPGPESDTVQSRSSSSTARCTRTAAAPPLGVLSGDDALTRCAQFLRLGAQNAGAIIFTWVFNNTRGSLLLVQLLHIFANTWITLFAAAPADNVITQWLFNGMLLLLAATVLVVCGARRP